MQAVWKPRLWVGVTLGVVLQPYTFLYLNKARLFWLYLILLCLVAGLDWYMDGYYSLAFSLICPIHAYYVVKEYDVSQRRAWFSKWWGIPAIFSLIFAVLFLVRSFLYEPFSIPAGSMSPNLNIGDHIIVQKFGYGSYGSYGIYLLETDVSEAAELKRGGIYIFRKPKSDVIYVKRLIGLPGDSIRFEKGSIVLNGKPLDERLLYEHGSAVVYEESLAGQRYSIQKFRDRPQHSHAEVKVPENSYFFVGDNRDNSNDSRYWGFVPSKNIAGKVVLVF